MPDSVLASGNARDYIYARGTNRHAARSQTISRLGAGRRAAVRAAPAWGANDRLAYGLIGAGGRGRYLKDNFQKLGAECVAIAEVYEPNLQKPR